MYIVLFIADDYGRLLEYEDQIQKLKAKVVVILIRLQQQYPFNCHLSGTKTVPER